MATGLRDRGQAIRFTAVSVVGMLADYAAALVFANLLGLPYLVASTCGFVIGSIINYIGHNLVSYEHTGAATISVLGWVKYFFAVILSLLVRLAAVALLEQLTALPFWIVLVIAIGASFVTSYVISTLWVFRKPG